MKDTKYISVRIRSTEEGPSSGSQGYVRKRFREPEKVLLHVPIWGQSRRQVIPIIFPHRLVVLLSSSPPLSLTSVTGRRSLLSIEVTAQSWRNSRVLPRGNCDETFSVCSLHIPRPAASRPALPVMPAVHVALLVPDELALGVAA